MVDAFNSTNLFGSGTLVVNSVEAFSVDVKVPVEVRGLDVTCLFRSFASHPPLTPPSFFRFVPTTKLNFLLCSITTPKKQLKWIH